MASMAAGHMGVVAAWSRYASRSAMGRSAMRRVYERGIDVVPPGDTHDMSTQLRLVEAPTGPRTRPPKNPAPVRAARARARARNGAGRRAAHWGDWELDARTRRVGRAGVAAARQALETARSEQLAQAS